MSETLWISGWAGVAWTSSYDWSCIPISLVIMATSGHLVAPAASRRRQILFVIVGSVLEVAAFQLLRSSLVELFSETMFGAGALAPTLLALAATILFPLGLTVAAHYILTPVHVWTAPSLGLGLVLVGPLSLATVEALPALIGATDALHAIKMGYPVFWAALAAPIALRLGVKRTPSK
jgi:hypothetical protein